MAKKRKGRAINGVLLLDKPYDMSSNNALQRVKHIYFAQKAGHTGALDPLATGMLPICLGEGTKFSQFLLDTDKTYQVTAKLGVRTTTSDADGEVVSEKSVDVSAEQLAIALDSFRGTTQQIPSMYSALKYQGQPLYKYAREGIEVPRESRDITVFRLDLLRFEGDEVDLDIHVSKGTYIRTIIDDLGELLGCGAHVAHLRRSAVGNYPTEKMVTIKTLETLLAQAVAEDVPPSVYLDDLLLPMTTACDGIPAVFVDDMSANFLRHGNPVQCSNAPANGLVQVFIGDDVDTGEFIGVGEIDDDGLVNPKRITVVG
ncbi:MULTISPECIES: tRNA pseudouridine(55) synthase TruB [unclassified Colwellia]|jgi:tRNA pseudouridine55 synthase|uniref:tRNA pseudouridine(55) synthase TruB n=1 Tax=unclassified Colwellia TaxID=196834 RepID=UPI0015F4B0C7|nr:MULTISPECIES: tRNA pseudouridine(55) synthase TruB [unclassified Colwellia]MBA6225074.1 tRNA pseudouridine(55) synthase TruB [Colwellia sp. MB3u-45]MBA6268638.1 tRNA pseudouridine(55) synthase TruB [Colwellia sp. MB3u-43]MBA6290147.1 tRNA pseudouridine(55) synthase TruB [Colwellia sp. MB3u-4]MBA6296437.1 tRNA pseudouridine(55) synthase TruB [Colwellia sp. MB02u-9]MBA6321069.1 tRNA pseudouridine(55) synthase TruB [Colwellia sp. MB02u-19]